MLSLTYSSLSYSLKAEEQMKNGQLFEGWIG